MRQSHRLAAAAGRSRPGAQFHLKRKPYEGYHGDTLASALLANGVALVGRSFKYHRRAAS